jgi:hypothetical protein
MARNLPLSICLLALVAQAGGCSRSANDYINSRPRRLPDAELDAAGPEAGAGRIGPEVVDVRRVAIASVEEARGLAHDGRHLFTTDRGDDTLVRLDPESGAELGRVALPARGAIGLTALAEDTLLVAYPDTLFRVEGERFTRVDGLFSEVAGVVATADAVITVQGSSIYVRERDTIAARLQLEYRGEPGPLVRLGADYLIYDQSPRLDGVTFAARFTVADALSLTSAAERGAVDLPVDVARVTGVAALGDVLWLLGSGQGTDAGQVLMLTLSLEPGR